MARYSKGIETKRKLILLTYRKLLEQNVSSITVRNLVAEAGYSPSALYRYFGSLDDLIVVASVRFLEEYIRGYAALLDRNDDFMKIYRDGWQLFNYHAFSRPDVFYGLFWGEYNGKFANAMEEYYQVFPFAGSQKAPDLFSRLFFQNDIYERDYRVLSEAAARGCISKEDAAYFSRVIPLLVKGILDEYRYCDMAERRKGENECNELIRSCLDRI